MKIILTILFILLHFFSLSQTQLTKGFFTDIELINPAAIGKSINTNLNLYMGTQWLIFGNEAPKHSIIDFNSRIFNKKYGEKKLTNHAYGIQFYGERSGVYNAYTLKLSYAYHVQINRITQLAFGLRALVSNGSINFNNIVLQQRNDPLLSLIDESSYVADIDFGILLYSEGNSPRNRFQRSNSIDYYIGFSSTRLLKRQNSFQEDNMNSLLQREYNLMGGVQIPVNRYFYSKTDFYTSSSDETLLNCYIIQTSFGYKSNGKSNEIGFGYSKYALKSYIKLSISQFSFKYSFFYPNTAINSYKVVAHTVSFEIPLFPNRRTTGVAKFK